MISLMSSPCNVFHAFRPQFTVALYWAAKVAKPTLRRSQTHKKFRRKDYGRDAM